MKVFLLSAGYGTRLKPITDKYPKCLVPINNIPLLELWFRLFQKYKIKDIIINTHYMHGKIVNYVQKYNQMLNITLSYGSLLKNKKYFHKESSFLVCYSDNLTNVNIDKFISFHDSHNLPISVGIFHSKNPWNCGIVELDSKNTIINFIEKPKNPIGDLANAGIYIFDDIILSNKELELNKILDIGNDLLPQFINKMKGYLIKEFILDIGTYENYTYANDYVSKHPDYF